MKNVYMLHDIMLQNIEIIKDVLDNVKIKLKMSQSEFNYFLNNRILRRTQVCMIL